MQRHGWFAAQKSSPPWSQNMSSQIPLDSAPLISKLASIAPVRLATAVSVEVQRTEPKPHHQAE